MANSVMTNLPTEIIYFPFFELIDNLSIEEIEQVRANVNKQASNAQLLQTYIENLCWADFKQMMSAKMRLGSRVSKAKLQTPFRVSHKFKDVPSESKLKNNVNMLTMLTGILNDDILKKKKRNIAMRKKWRKEKMMKLPKIGKGNKDFLELNKNKGNLYKMRTRLKRGLKVSQSLKFVGKRTVTI